MSIELVMPSNHLILCQPLFLLPLIFPRIEVFLNECILHIRWPKYWSFSFSISPSNEYSGLISFRSDWFDFLALQGTLKSLLQYQSPKASVLQCSAFFFFFSFIFISWRLITLQYCSGFCHTWTWISHGFTCTPHPDPPSHLSLYPIPLGFPSAPGPQCSAFFMVQLSHPYLTTGKITALKKPYFWTVPVQDLFPNVTYIRTSCHVYQLSITSWC